MREGQMALLIPIFTVLGAFAMIIFLRRYQNIERMSMIERGMNPGDMKSVWRRFVDPYRHLRAACTAVGIGLGFILGSIFKGGFSNNDTGETVLVGCVVMFGGLGLLAGYILQLGLQNKAKKEGIKPEDEEI
jgi:hypothetical protein